MFLDPAPSSEYHPFCRYFAIFLLTGKHMIPGFRTKHPAYAGLAVHHERLSMMKLKQIKKHITFTFLLLLFF